MQKEMEVLHSTVIIFILLSSLLHITICTVYTVTPDDHYYPNTTCHHCHNLQHYLLNITEYFTSNTQLFFLPGLHHLHTDLIIQNVHNISLIGSTANGTTLDTVIQCNLLAGIMMTNITNLTVKNLLIRDCKIRMIFDKYPYDELRFSMLIRDCKDVVVQHLSADKNLIGINILGISQLHNVSCNKIFLRYTEMQTQKKHHNLLIISYFQILNDFIFEDIIEVSMYQLSYEVTIQLSNTIIQDEIETFMVINNINHMSMLVIINCQFYHNYGELFVFHHKKLSSDDNSVIIHFTNCQFLHNIPTSLIKTFGISIKLTHCFFNKNSGALEVYGNTFMLTNVIINKLTYHHLKTRPFV